MSQQNKLKLVVFLSDFLAWIWVPATLAALVLCSAAIGTGNGWLLVALVVAVAISAQLLGRIIRASVPWRDFEVRMTRPGARARQLLVS